jgi:hypothetical protein
MKGAYLLRPPGCTYGTKNPCPLLDFCFCYSAGQWEPCRWCKRWPRECRCNDDEYDLKREAESGGGDYV